MPPVELRRSPWSYLIWSERRDDAGRVAEIVAAGLDAEYEWIQIEPPGDAPPRPEEHPDGVDAREQVHRVQPRETGPDDSGASVALCMTFKDREESPAVDHTIRFARLPEPVRKISSKVDPDGPSRSLVIAQADRATFQFPDSAGTLKPYLEVLKRSNISPIFTYGRSPRPNRVDFDVVLRVDRSSTDDRALVTVERGAHLLSGHRFQKGSIPLDEFQAAWHAS